MWAIREAPDRRGPDSAFLLAPFDGALDRAAARDNALKQQLVRFLEDGGEQARLSPPASRSTPLRVYPVTATTAFLLLENDPLLLRRFYPDFPATHAALRRNEPGRRAASSGACPAPRRDRASTSLPPVSTRSPRSSSTASISSPGKQGRTRTRSNFSHGPTRLADLVTRSFYDPARECFYPVDAHGRFVTAYRGPGQLLPLVTDRSSADRARRIAADTARGRASARSRSERSIGSRRTRGTNSSHAIHDARPPLRLDSGRWRRSLRVAPRLGGRRPERPRERDRSALDRLLARQSLRRGPPLPSLDDDIVRS